MIIIEFFVVAWKNQRRKQKIKPYDYYCHFSAWDKLCVFWVCGVVDRVPPTQKHTESLSKASHFYYMYNCATNSML